MARYTGLAGISVLPAPWRPGCMRGNRGTETRRWQPWRAAGSPVTSALRHEPRTRQQTFYGGGEMQDTERERWREDVQVSIYSAGQYHYNTTV